MNTSTSDRIRENLAVDRNSAVHSGDLVFRGTRVPVTTLTDVLEAGGTIEEFLEAFPSVERWQVDSLLDLSAEAVEQLTAETRAHSR